MFEKRFGFVLAVLILGAGFASADPTPSNAEDQAREQAIAEFTQKMKDANYPALFEKAAQEFNVPADVLKGIAFAETRWSHLQWPPGETVSPENGMPRPYGIMSLWDNDYFGHTLTEAAKLIGQDPEALKQDPYQNMRGAAALLRKLYDETPKPADAQGDEIESWRKAIARYTGIPQPELSEAHALKVYEFMNRGYSQYGIEWPAHPVHLDPMRADVARIRAEAQAKMEAKMKAEAAAQAVETNSPAQPAAALSTNAQVPKVVQTNLPAARDIVAPTPANQLRQRWLLLGLIVLLLVIAGIYLSRRPRGSKT